MEDMSAHDLNILLASAGGLALILGLFSGAIKGIISLPLAAMLTGILLGPDLLNVLRFLEGVDQHFFLEQTARISMAMGLVSISLRFSRTNLKEIWKTASALVLSAMFLMWALSSLISFLDLSQSILMALLIGAIITPTDPVVAGSITTGKKATENLPRRIRLLISLESGLCSCPCCS
jgi:NhaP-type Na+/H+ or K+/H+ antiporter